MIDDSYMAEYEILSQELTDNSECAIIILNNSSDSVSYRMEFIKNEIPEFVGIKLKVKDQYNNDLYMDGFLVDNKVIPWVFEEIKQHLGE